jgi:hypothetical protein
VCNAQSNDLARSCGKCGADLAVESTTARARANFLANGRVRAVRIVHMDNCCRACAGHYGTYPKDQVPVLPVEGCSHELGCRCFYQPELTEIYP